MSRINWQRSDDVTDVVRIVISFANDDGETTCWTATAGNSRHSAAGECTDKINDDFQTNLGVVVKVVAYFKVT